MIQQEPIDLFVSCDNRFTWDQMVKAATGKVIPDAAPTFALKNSAGSTVTGSTGTMTAITGKRGGYEGVIPSTVSLTAGDTYYLEITTSIDGNDDFRRIECEARYRGLR